MSATNKRGEIYKCNVCGNIVELLEVGGGELVCCGEPMQLMTEKGKSEEGREKHVPVISKDKISVGSVPHPMEEKHYIMWIEAEVTDGTSKKFLKPGDSPTFNIKNSKSAREYCNIHGLWRSEK